MAGEMTAAGNQYSSGVGLVYVFNLIVGTGALTMPKAFAEAGWLLSLITVIILAFMSFLTTTFVIEALAISNAKLIFQKRKQTTTSINDSNSSDEDQPLLGVLGNSVMAHKNPYDILERVELGKMASFYFNKVGVTLFYICMVIYLFGDLSIYAAAVPKSLRDVVCTYKLPNGTLCNVTLTDSDPCWPGKTLTRMDMYRVFVATFMIFLGPFTFFNIQKTKLLQIITTVFRWLAFGIMIVLAVKRLALHQGQGRPMAADIAGMPNLFGVCVYSFMCHHSLPSMLTPIKDKSKLVILLGGDFLVILCFYAVVSFTGIYAFRELQDLYTLNFLPDACIGEQEITNIKFIEYFLALFPVFTLSTNFPIISITLRNNLKTMFQRENQTFPWIVDRIAFPLMAICPPIAVAMATNQVEFLVGFTGSYAGAAIQYVIPALLVYFARKDILCTELDTTNAHTSPFRHSLWILFVCIWAGMCTVFVTVNHIITRS